MPRRRRCMVILTQHAYQRWRERGGVGELSPEEVRRSILRVLSLGVEVRNMAIEVPLRDGMMAVCVPEFDGFWSVVTVVKK